MNLRDTTRDLIGQAEQQTGYMVEVGPNRALANMSTVIVVGRHTLLTHVICYNPYFEHILDCLVGFQYGMFLRLFASLLQEKARKAGGDIALLGPRWLDIHDPVPRYTLRALPDELSGMRPAPIM